MDNLHAEFEKAVAFINNYTDPFAPDLLLKLYAYYKIANENYDNPEAKLPLSTPLRPMLSFRRRTWGPKRPWKNISSS